jgi:histidinol-phosphatase
MSTQQTGKVQDDLSAELKFALTLADIADAISLSRYHALDLVITTKPDNTPVTDADKAVETAIRDAIASEFPTDGIVGEEFGDSAADQKSAGRYWVIDPIDGTKNYLRGVPTWATLIALVEDGQVILGVVSAPALYRRWYAEKGAGSFLIENGNIAKKISVSSVKKLSDASIAYSDFQGWGDRLLAFHELLKSAWRTRGVGDFWSHMLVAEGAVEAAIEPSLALWDMAPIDIIVREAGGRFISLEGVDGPFGLSALSTNSQLRDEILARLGHKQ